MKKRRKKLTKKGRAVLLSLMAIILIIVGTVIFFEQTKDDEALKPEIGKIDDISLIEEEPNIEKTLDPLRFMMLNVGQGLAIFIDYGDYEILYDAGSYNNGKSKVSEKIKPFVSGDLELVIASHSHEDHIGGFSKVYDDFNVKKTIYGNLTDDVPSKIFKEKAMAEGGAFEEDKDLTIDLGDKTTLTIYDIADNEIEINNNSVVCLLKHGENSFLMTGDLFSDKEKLLKKKMRDVTVVVAGHHGANTSNSILSTLNPQYFLISCEKSSKDKPSEYGHPHKSVLEEAIRYSTYVYGTYVSGDIELISDGKNISTEKEYRQLSMDDVGWYKGASEEDEER